MGNWFSSPIKTLEDRIVKTQNNLHKIYKLQLEVRKLNSILNFFIFFEILVLVIYLSTYCFFSKSELLPAVISSIKSFMPAIFSVFAFDFFLLLVFHISDSSLDEKIITMRYFQKKYLEEYQSQPRYKQVMEMLAANGKIPRIRLSNRITAKDCGAFKMEKQSDNILSRILSYISRNGPDHNYAVICPHCHGHNDLISGPHRKNMQYMCFKCNHFVSFSEVLNTEPLNHVSTDPEIDNMGVLPEFGEK